MTAPAFDWIAYHANHSPGKTAAVDLHSKRRFTYGEMNERVGRLAGYLSSGLGVEPGDRVAVLSANSTDVFEIQFACFRLGAVFVPLNWRLAPAEVKVIVADCGARVLIADDDNAAAAAEVMAGGGVDHLVDVAGDGGDSAYERGLAGAPAVHTMAAQSHDDICTILYTSGTTGRPKGAIITHGMVFWNAINLGIPFGIGPDTVFLDVLPLFHTAGLNCHANPVFHGGGQVVMMRNFDPAAALAVLADRELGIDKFFGVPAIYLFMAQQPGFAEADLSRLELAGVGGAPISTALIDTWTTRGVKLVQGFGMTETSPAVMFLTAAEAERKVGSAGKPALHNEVRIVDDKDREVAPGEVGELQVRGPNITPGYWNNATATEAAFTDRWLRTGDAARQDEEGFYYIVDRWKDMYISGGENVYPAEVEEVLYAMPGIAEVAVIGVEDEKWGEVGRAVVVSADGADITEDQVIDYCKGKVGNFKLPTSVVFTEVLPRNATGKVLKHELRATFG
jgi:fatty-acyl-CoA synthase